MATEIETWMLSYRTDTVSLEQGEKALQRIYSSLDQIEEAARDATAAEKTLATVTASTGAALTDQVAGMNRAAVARQRWRRGIDEAGASPRNAGRGIQEFGWIVQDFVGGGGMDNLALGVRAISNNLDRMALALGFGTGVAGAGAGPATPFPMGAPAVQEFWRSLGPQKIGKGTPPRAEMEAKIKEIEDKKIHLAVDQTELENAKAILDEFKKGLAEFQRGMESRTADEKAAGAEVAAALEGAPGGRDDLQRRMREQEEGSILAADAEAGRAREKANSLREQRRRIMEEIDSGTLDADNRMIREGWVKAIDRQLQQAQATIRARTTKAREAASPGRAQHAHERACAPGRLAHGPPRAMTGEVGEHAEPGPPPGAPVRHGAWHCAHRPEAPPGAPALAASGDRR